MRSLLPLYIFSAVLLARPTYRLLRGRLAKDGYINIYDLLMILYGGTTLLLCLTIPHAEAVSTFINDWAGWGLAALVLYLFIPKFYIAPKLYGTIGLGCEKMRFVRSEARVGYARYNWQMVEPHLFGLIWTPKHQACNEHECNYYEVSR
jgi:hypothetical protein